MKDPTTFINSQSGRVGKLTRRIVLNVVDACLIVGLLQRNRRIQRAHGPCYCLHEHEDEHETVNIPFGPSTKPDTHNQLNSPISHRECSS